MISQKRKIKAASLLQIPAFEELLNLVLNYIWTIMWKVFKMRGLGSHNSFIVFSVILPYVTFEYAFGMFTHFSEKRTAMTK
jgi:hypothetical protein